MAHHVGFATWPMSAAGGSRHAGMEGVRRFCDGFRMPANADLSTGTRAGVRKPPKNETAGTRAPGGSACAMGKWLAPLPGHGPEDVGTAVDASDGHQN
jgi:hypothetical protein